VVVEAADRSSTEVYRGGGSRVSACTGMSTGRPQPDSCSARASATARRDCESRGLAASRRRRQTMKKMRAATSRNSMARHATTMPTIAADDMMPSDDEPDESGRTETATVSNIAGAQCRPFTPVPNTFLGYYLSRITSGPVYSRWSFAVAGPSAANSLPDPVRNPSATEVAFRSLLEYFSFTT